MQAIIMAGGEGKRLRPITSGLPKPLLLLGGKALLDHIIDYLKPNGITEIIICTGYLGEKIREHVERKDYGISIEVSQEKKPLGTAGPLHLIKEKLRKEFFVLYGDVYTTVNLGNMLEFHREKKGIATLAVRKSDHPEDSTVVMVNSGSRIIKFVEKPGSDWHRFGDLTSAAIYILNKQIIEYIEAEKETDFARDVFPKIQESGEKLYGYVIQDYTKDVGTPKRYMEVEEYLR